MGQDIDRQQFAEHVREALAHLYDHRYLQAHPLAELLEAGSGAEATGRTLHRVLVEAIHRMRPPADLCPNSASWRKYRYLQLRYIQARSAADVAQELGISERQAQRDQRQAMDELASLLWLDHLRGVRTGYPPRPNGGADETAPPPQTAAGPFDSDSLEQEITRIGNASGEEPVRVPEITQGVLATIARLAADKQVTLLARVPDDLPLAAVGRSALRQALLGLLVYGIGQSGAKSVELSANGAQRRINLCVCVTTAALSPPSTTPTSNGQLEGPDGGLPRRAAESPAAGPDSDNRLAVARRLIEMQGGSVRIGAVEGLLSIDVELPCTVSATVLLIDDNPDVLRLFERYLAGGVSRVLRARTAQEAIELARMNHPDVITLDVMMPSQDGWEILQVLKNDEETQTIPVIVCSVLREQELALSLGASDFLAKPITQQALLRAVQRCLVS